MLFSYFELCKSLCLLPHGVCVLMVTALRKHPRDSAGGATKVSRKSVRLNVKIKTFKEPDEEIAKVRVG